MANQFITNQTPATYAYCMYNLLNVMYNAGWSIMAWSDGTTAHNTGTIPGPYKNGPGTPDAVFPLTGAFPNTGAGGAGGLDNSQAWFVMRQPAGTGSVTPGNALGSPYGGNRMITFQRGTSTNDFQWRIKYSVGPTSGHVSQYQFASQAGVAPSLYASAVQDEYLLMGGGTDGAPTFATLFGGVASNRGLVRFNCMANDGLSGETSPFSIWAAAWKSGAGFYPDMGFIFDALVPGTTPAGELDPFILGADTNPGSANNGSFCISGGNQASCFFTYAGAGASVTCWFRYGLASAQAQRIQVMEYCYTDSGLNLVMCVPGQNNRGNPIATNAINSDDELFPIPYGRSPAVGSGQSGFKGVGSMMKFNSSVRATGDTQAQSTVRDRIILGVVSVPWDASVPTL